MSRADPSEIPHRLELVIDFVNTLDVEEGLDALDGPAALVGWLSAEGLLAGDSPAAGAGDLLAALELREALRTLLLENNGAEHDPRAWEALERAAGTGGLEVHFDGDGGTLLLARAGGVAGALAGLLEPVARATGDGSWRRVKACRADDCGWAFYDRSRNRSARWCEMAVCGNRTKVRAYRERTPRRRPGPG